MQRKRVARAAKMASWLKARAPVVLVLALLQAVLCFLPGRGWSPARSASRPSQLFVLDEPDHPTLSARVHASARPVRAEQAEQAEQIDPAGSTDATDPSDEEPGDEALPAELTSDDLDSDGSEDAREESRARGENDSDAGEDGDFRTPNEALTMLRAGRGVRLCRACSFLHFSTVRPGDVRPAERRTPRVILAATLLAVRPLPLPRLLL